MSTPVQTIQATSKKWKLLKLLGVLAIMFGMLIFVSLIVITAGSKQQEFGFFHGLSCVSVSGGLAMFVFARLMAWWHHG
jgi:hypothetical protein